MTYKWFTSRFKEGFKAMKMLLIQKTANRWITRVVAHDTGRAGRPADAFLYKGKLHRRSG